MTACCNSSFTQYVICLSLIFLLPSEFFFVIGFQQFEYDLLRSVHLFVCICVKGCFLVYFFFFFFSVSSFWGFLSFFDLWFAVFHCFRKILSHYVFKYFSSLF